MNIQNISINRIKPYENNPRVISDDAVEKVMASIKEFGFQQPIVVDKDMVVIVGHTRLKASKKLGLKEVPVVIADNLTEEQARAYRLADNKTNEFSKWADDLLTFELQELECLNFDMEQFGFEAIFEEEPDIEEDDYEIEPVEVNVQLGDIYQLGDHRLMCGDSTDKECVASLMDGNKADMVFTDPPYGVDVVGDNGEVGANFGIAKKGNYSKIIADDTTETAKKALEICKEICSKLIIWGGNYFVEFLPPNDSWLIWDKRVDSGIRNTFADGEMAWCSFHTPVRIYHQLWNGMIREGEHNKRVHPTQKPIRMLGEILTDFTKENETVLDLFGGSGSTLIACEQLNRKCFMMELDPYYCQVIIDRWEQFTGNKAVKVS